MIISRSFSLSLGRSDYNDFLDIATGEHGLYKENADDYMKAGMKKLTSAGIDLAALMHRK